VEITRPKAAAATVDRRSIERVIYGRSSAFDEKEWGGGKGGGISGCSKRECEEEEEEEEREEEEEEER
jgi:hypothetical protein